MIPKAISPARPTVFFAFLIFALATVADSKPKKANKVNVVVAEIALTTTDVAVAVEQPIFVETSLW